MKGEFNRRNSILSDRCHKRRTFHCANYCHSLTSFNGISTKYLAMILFVLFIQPCLCIVHFFSPEDLKYTFGVDHLSKVPKYTQLYPRIIRDPAQPNFRRLFIELDGKEHSLDFESVTKELLADRLTIVERDHQSGGSLVLNFANEENLAVDDCHFHHRSNETFAALSTCDGTLKGIIVKPDSIHVIHPVPERHMARLKRSASDEENDTGLHIIYKREAQQEDFCGIENTITSEELVEDEAGVVEDVFVVGQRLTQESELVVELAIFVDEFLWRHFSSRYGALAWQKLQQYALTMLNNIQIMYRQPTAIPQLTFRVVRYEVFKTQPSAMAPHLHDNGHAQRYLDRFCRFQRSLGAVDWDHALLLTGYDIHRGSGSRSISGIARLDGMCDPWNTCTLAEGLDFTSAFIGTHELGHSVGMRHDEPYCTSRFIMSASLGPGKVTWSTCSLRDYHTFVQRLDGRRKNCLRMSNQREKLPLTDVLKPGQIYDANLQCTLMHGNGYVQVTPRQDHYDGICYMMWCGQGTYGRIITSHPALEGTFCGPSKWCQLGRCVPWTGFGAPLPPRPAVMTTPALPTPIAPAVGYYKPPYAKPAPPYNPDVWKFREMARQRAIQLQYLNSLKKRPPPPAQNIGFARRRRRRRREHAAWPHHIDGQWSAWAPFVCSQCSCSSVAGSVGLTLSARSCSNPAPQNGGSECEGSTQRAAVCNRKCSGSTSVNQYISDKCAEHKRVKNDEELSGTGSQLSRFPQRACKVFCDVKDTLGSQRSYRFYGDNLPDGTPCGFDRFCLAGECFDLSCDESALLPRDLGCPPVSERCPLVSAAALSSAPSTALSGGAQPAPNSLENVKGSWGTWSLWSSCTTTCGGGFQMRSRTCNINNRCEGSPTEKMVCNTQTCPTTNTQVGDQWTDWTSWNQCSVSCGRGSQARYRRCTTPQSTIAYTCPGQTMDIRTCDELPCSNKPSSSVGLWASWGDWGTCSKTCGPGTQTRYRQCTKEPCDGAGQQRLACNLRECAQWNEWGVFSECSKLCGRGLRSRSRTCPSGATCTGASIEQTFCNEHPCDPGTSTSSGQWSGWSEWSGCSVSCGTGVKRRTRHCQSGNCPGLFRESAICNDGPCSVSDASWGGWGYWSQCSESCGNGIRRRVRKCYGSGACYGNEYERENCHMRDC